MLRSQNLNCRLAWIGASAFLAMLSLPSPAAAQFTWIGGVPPAFWDVPSYWTPSGPPNLATATATFAGQGLGTINVGSSFAVQSLSFSNATGSYTLASSGASLSGVTSITVGAGVTGVQTINLANISTGSLLIPANNNLTITNNSTAAGTTLVIGPNTVIGALGNGGVVVTGAGTTQISGTFASAGNSIGNGLTKNGAGTLILSHLTPFAYLGGTTVNAGTLMLGTGSEIPAGTNVTVNGGQFNLGSGGNSSPNAIGTLAVNGSGSFRVPSGSSNYFVNRLQMTGGTIDFTGSANFDFHLLSSSSTITTFASSTTATWVGSGTSRIQNDAGSAQDITVNQGTTPSGIDLDAGIILSASGSSPNFAKAGNGTMRLNNSANTANFSVYGGALRVDDVTSGPSGFGALGSGDVFIQATLQYGGPTATLTKSLSMISPTFQVLTPGTNLTYAGSATFGALSALSMSGPGAGQAPSTLTLVGNQSYSGPTIVYGNGILAVPTISDAGPTASVVLGGSYARGTLMLIGTSPSGYSTNRAVTVDGPYPTGGGAIGVSDLNTNLNWTGPISGTGSLIKTGPGTLTLTNATNNYTGGTYVEAGTLSVGANGAVIPANSDVTVSSGAIFRTENAVSNGSAPLRTVTLNGGTFQSLYFYSVNRMVFGSAGGLLSLSANGASGNVYLVGLNAGATINGNALWSGDNNSTVDSFGGVDLTIAPNATLTNNARLVGGFRILGGGTFYTTAPVHGDPAAYTVSQGRVRADDLSVDAFGWSVFGSAIPGVLTLDGGSLQYSGSTASTPIPISLSPIGGAVEVSNAATTLTLTGAISGFGPLNKTGPGVLILNNLANSYAGGITVSGGRLDVSDDAQLGMATVAVNPAGTLRYTASTATGRTFNLNGGTLETPSGVTLTMNGATVNGGFLRGPGTLALAAGTTLYGVSTATSSNINQTGTASAFNFTNFGSYSLSPSQSLTLTNATNMSAGRMTINGAANVSDFTNNGLLNIPAGGVVNNSVSNMTFGGGSTTFVGSVASPGGKIDLGGQQLIVRGGLLVTNAGSFGSGNGVRNGTTVADYGALVKGTGPYQAVITQNGGQYLPGNSPGTSQVGDFFINGGGNLIFEITDAGPSASFPSAPGVAGSNPGWGLTQVFNSLNFTATPSNKFNIDMRTQLAPPAAPNSPGQMASFDPTRAYSWKVFDLQPGAVFNGTFDANAINFITTQVANSTNGGAFSLSRTGGQVFLTFTPAPEPAMILGAAFVGLFGWWGLQRRRRPETRTV